MGQQGNQVVGGVLDSVGDLYGKELAKLGKGGDSSLGKLYAVFQDVTYPYYEGVL